MAPLSINTCTTRFGASEGGIDRIEILTDKSFSYLAVLPKGLHQMLTVLRICQTANVVSIGNLTDDHRFVTQWQEATLQDRQLNDKHRAIGLAVAFIPLVLLNGFYACSFT